MTPHTKKPHTLRKPNEENENSSRQPSEEAENRPGEEAENSPGEEAEETLDLPEKPALRSDILLSPAYGEEGGLIVKDPEADRYYRFVGGGASLIEALDGTHTLDELQEILQEEAPGPLPPGTAAQFVKSLDDRLLLERNLERAALKKEIRTRLKRRQNPFYYRIPLFNPERFLAWLTPYLRPLFHPISLVIMGLLIAAGIAAMTFTPASSILVVGRFELFEQHLLLYYIVFLGLVALHEFGHAFTCTYFGGRVKEMGFIFIFFNPCYYCNISDTYLFPKRSHRMWVSFAGAYVELAVWGLCQIFLLLRPEGALLEAHAAFSSHPLWFNSPTPTSSVFFQVLSAVAITAGLRSVLFNLNPLLRLDGYYLLSDYLEIPNLRIRAFQTLGESLQNLGRFLLRRPRQALSPVPRRRFLLGYAILSTFYMGLILLFVGVWLPQRLYPYLGFVSYIIGAFGSASILWGLYAQLFRKAKTPTL